MGNPGYYLSASSPEDVIELPCTPSYGNEQNAIGETDVENQTSGGQIWIQKLYSQREFHLPFVITGAADLAKFQALHDTMGGQATPFYFLFDVDSSPKDAVRVRKEQDFDVREQPSPVVLSDVLKVYDYILHLRVELARMFIPLKLDGVLYPRDTFELYQALPGATLVTNDAEDIVFSHAVFHDTVSMFDGGWLISGTPVQVFYGRGWIAGQIETLRANSITPYLQPGTADYFDWYGV